MRETAEVDQRSGKPLVICLEVGGKFVRIRAKGDRKEYTVTIKEIWVQGARNQAAAEKAARQKRKQELAQARK